MAVLKKGAKGKPVAQLQTVLNKNGASPKLKVDEFFGPITEAAVKAYQKKKKLNASGAVEEITGFALGIGPRPESLTLHDINDSIKAVQGRMTHNLGKYQGYTKQFGQAAGDVDKLKVVLQKRQTMLAARAKLFAKTFSDLTSKAKKSQDSLLKEYQKTKDPAQIKKLIAAMAKVEYALKEDDNAAAINNAGIQTVKELKQFQTAVAALKSKIDTK